MKKKLLPIILLAIGALIGISQKNGWFGSQKDTDRTENATNYNFDYDIAKIEIPTVSKIGRDEEIIEHLGYTTCYNTSLLIPSWVAYELTDEEVTGTLKRSDNFLPDPDVRGRCANTNDYKKSGYDRGHLAPAADMKWSEQAMEESFYMSNICPQNHNLNAGDWKDLEEQVRDWAIKNESIYVACGPIVDANYKTIGENKVAVPKAFYKVLLMYKNNSWRTIAFLFNNKAGSKPLHKYALSVDEIEEMTNMDFFAKLPNDIENEIEQNRSIQQFEN